jgi:hypothetical protein
MQASRWRQRGILLMVMGSGFYFADRFWIVFNTEADPGLTGGIGPFPRSAIDAACAFLFAIGFALYKSDKGVAFWQRIAFVLGCLTLAYNINEFVIPKIEYYLSFFYFRQSKLAANLQLTAILTAVGCGLHQWKTKALRSYARAEIGFGIISIYVSLAQVDGINLRNVTLVLGSLYVIVRGLDNRKKDLDDGPKTLQPEPNWIDPDKKQAAAI